MPTPAPFTETYFDITAICPERQDAVVAVPVEQRVEAGVARVRGLNCSRCGFAIILSRTWMPRWLSVAQR